MSHMKEHAIANYLGPFGEPMTEAEVEHASAVTHYDKSLTDGVAALCSRDALAYLATNHQEDYEKLRQAVYSFEAEMLNEEPDHAS